MNELYAAKWNLGKVNHVLAMRISSRKKRDEIGNLLLRSTVGQSPQCNFHVHVPITIVKCKNNKMLVEGKINNAHIEYKVSPWLVIFCPTEVTSNNLLVKKGKHKKHTLLILVTTPDFNSSLNWGSLKQIKWVTLPF